MPSQSAILLSILALAAALTALPGQAKTLASAAITPQMTCPAPGVDTDGDGVCDDEDLDDDNDGMPDAYESANRLDPLAAADALQDLDLDGAPNLVEFRAGTDPDDAGSVPDSATSTITAASVLPLSRSTTVGNTVTAFATLLNASSNELTNCTIAPSAPLTADFFFNATDPVTNAPAGEINAGVNVPVSGGASFIVGFTPSGEFSSRDVALRFACDNAPPVPALPGINTLRLSASTTPVADIVALALTATGDGVLRIPDITDPGAFSVASVNLGAADTLNVTAQAQNDSDLPISVSVCQTDSATGACINPVSPAAEASIAIGENEVPTFSVFVSASEELTLDAAARRISVTFSDGSGEVRGSTSVAIEALAPPPVAEAPTFTEVQAVFTQSCALSGCHNAVSARAGLSLQAPAFGNIVGVFASEIPALQRIQPGNSADSYIVRKIVGGPDLVGSRMPLGSGPLPQATIDLIRDWVDAGAANN